MYYRKLIFWVFVFFQNMRIFKLFWKFWQYLRFWLLGACQLPYDHHIDTRQFLYVETTNFYIFLCIVGQQAHFENRIFEAFEIFENNFFLNFLDIVKFFVCLMYYNTKSIRDKFLCSWRIFFIIIGILGACYNTPNRVEVGLMTFLSIFCQSKNFLWLMCAKKFFSR